MTALRLQQIPRLQHDAKLIGRVRDVHALACPRRLHHEINRVLERDRLRHTLEVFRQGFSRIKQAHQFRSVFETNYAREFLCPSHNQSYGMGGV